MLQKAIRHAPEFAQAYTTLGDTCDLTGQYQDAIKHYQEAIRLNPSLIKAYLNVANIYTHKVKDEDKARYYLKKAERLRNGTLHMTNGQ